MLLYNLEKLGQCSNLRKKYCRLIQSHDMIKMLHCASPAFDKAF